MAMKDRRPDPEIDGLRLRGFVRRAKKKGALIQIHANRLTKKENGPICDNDKDRISE